MPKKSTMSAMVRYVVRPVMMCPNCCASTNRCSSRSSSSSVPELITMNGWSKPTAPELAIGVCATYSCGAGRPAFGQSSDCNTS